MARDRRYKVNKKIIASMRRMRRTGASYRVIGEAHGVSGATALYWIDDAQRRKQRAKNAKRKYPPGDKVRIKRDTQKRADNWVDSPEMRLRHTIQSAKDEKRSTRHTVKGILIEDALEMLESGELKKENNKMGE